MTAVVDLLNTFHGNLVHLFCASVRRLMETDGIGFQEACKIKAVFELTKRIAAYCDEDHPKIASKDDVTKILAPHMMFLPQEEFRVMLLDAKQKLIPSVIIYNAIFDVYLDSECILPGQTGLGVGMGVMQIPPRVDVHFQKRFTFGEIETLAGACKAMTSLTQEDYEAEVAEIKLFRHNKV